MSTPVRWPQLVPWTPLRAGFAAPSRKNLIRTQMERGAKQRRVATGTPHILPVNFRFKREEYQRFLHWFENDLAGGVLEFYWFHPDDGRMVIAGFVAKEGQAFKAQPAPAGARIVSAEFEIRELN